MSVCEQCGKEHEGTFGSGRFCCRSCSNKWVALHQSEEAKARKCEVGARNLIHDGSVGCYNKEFWTESKRQRHSEIMSKIMESPDIRKRISDKMKGNTLSEESRAKISYKVKLSHIEGRNKGWVTRRGVESYAEKFWRSVLDINNIPYEQEKKVLHSELGLSTKSCYFLDFYLPEKNVDLEIDGHQHYEESIKVRDKLRDENLTKCGYLVYRIKFVNPSNSLVVENDINNFLQWYRSI